MIAIDVPGFGALRLDHLVADFNGTLAVDGTLVPGVEPRIRALASRLSIHVLTADTAGTVRAQTAHLPVEVTIVASIDQADAKLDFIRALDCATVIAIGNGRNDRSMLSQAALGVGVVQGEGAAAETLSVAHVVVNNILDALDLVLVPQRLVATLRA